MTIDQDQLTAYALGILPPEEEGRVRAAIEADPALRAQLDADLAALVALSESLPDSPVPAGAEDRLMARLHAERSAAGPAAPLVTPLPALSEAAQTVSAPAAPLSRPARRPLWPLLGTLGLAAAVTAVLLLRPAPDPVRQYANTPGAVTETLPYEGRDLGQLVRLPDGRAYLHLTNAADAGRVYQLWQIVGGKPASLGVFDGQGILITGLEAGATIAVSVEPTGGSEQPTTTPILVREL
ncbi:anti-sigma factor [Deinococcus puniceus]|uniref:Regulator of SigK n=1 Tax=Deinococcus puniceus TaxID=1182568 RepID=A0A172T889_9DEIO|nr:anti-sigma factor [Deinococcus puniceus]ANE43201.1 anti-sigmaE protein [Deinococcus puniceus]